MWSYKIVLAVIATSPVTPTIDAVVVEITPERASELVSAIDSQKVVRRLPGLSLLSEILLTERSAPVFTTFAALGLGAEGPREMLFGQYPVLPEDFVLPDGEKVFSPTVHVRDGLVLWSGLPMIEEVIRFPITTQCLDRDFLCQIIAHAAETSL